MHKTYILVSKKNKVWYVVYHNAQLADMVRREGDFPSFYIVHDAKRF